MSPARPLSGRSWLAPVLLALAVLAAYANAWRVPFLYDDAPAIMENATLRRLSDVTALLHPPPASTAAGRPLLNVSLALNHAWGGLDVRGYHAANLAIHFLAGLTLFGLVRRTLARLHRRDAAASPDTAIAFVVALCWVLHPLQTEAVTYVVQRAESLMALLFLLTLYAFARGADSAPGHRARWYVTAIGACAAGMATKEVMVVAPILVLLYDRAFLWGECGAGSPDPAVFSARCRAASPELAAASARRDQEIPPYISEPGFPSRERSPLRAGWADRRWIHVALAATWLLLLLLVTTAGTRAGSAGFGLGVSPARYALGQGHAILHYLRLTLWPYPLVFDYGTHLALPAAEAWMDAGIVLFLVAATAVAVVRAPRAGFVGAWFFAVLAPTSSFVPIVTEPMAEHRMYLALAAPLAAVLLGVHGAVGRRLFAAAALAAVALGLLTSARNRAYASPVRLWSDTIAHAPANPRAHNQLGHALFAAADLAGARREYQTALALDPSDPEAHYNLGTMAWYDRDVPRAIAEFEATLRLAPAHAKAHDNLGLAYAEAGRLEDSLREHARAVALAPDSAVAHNNHGIALGRLGRLPEAIAEFQRALALDPDYADARNNLAFARKLVTAKGGEE